MRIQPLAKRLVTAAEETEAALEEGERWNHAAVAEQHERLNKRSARIWCERVVVGLEETTDRLWNRSALLWVALAHMRNETQQWDELCARRCRGWLLLDDGEDRLELAESA
jgi:hypothetical protein